MHTVWSIDFQLKCKNTQQEKDSFSVNGAGKTGCSHAKEYRPLFYTHVQKSTQNDLNA
jgi:hypothetical protein